MARIRLDMLLVQKGLAESREKAQRVIRTGRVRIDGQSAGKPGHLVDDNVVIDVVQPERFVSRGGEKLEAAMQHFQIDVAGLMCMDVGASTGGFTDCLLQRGATHVYDIDVGRGQLHWKLRNDPRVTVMEGVNARYLQPGDLLEKPGFAVVDVSFISLTKILVPVTQAMAVGSGMVTLIKPQFEAGRKHVCRGGVVKDLAVIEGVIESIRLFGSSRTGFTWQGVIPSPVRGPAGNTEFLAYWKGQNETGHYRKPG